MARFLQPAQHHDLDERADMERLGRGIKADIGWDDTRNHGLIKALIIGAIGQKAALHHDTHEFRFWVIGHFDIPWLLWRLYRALMGEGKDHD